MAVPLDVLFDASQFNTARGAHTGKLGKKMIGRLEEQQKEWETDELVEELGFCHYEWDGVTPTPLVDSSSRICSVLAGRPTASGLLEHAAQAHSMLMELSQAFDIEGLWNNEKHSPFPAFQLGSTRGMGSSEPVPLRTDNQLKGMEAALWKLVKSIPFKSLSGYQNSAFSVHGPSLHQEYSMTVETMYEKLPELPHVFDRSVFTAAAFNLGGYVRTYKHRDDMNWVFGWCAITALGKFDPKRSTWLILWEFKLVIDFPPGSTVLIPSAVITHSNTPIAEGDECTSFMQYTAGAIFCWVQNVCMMEKKIQEKNEAQWQKIQDGKAAAFKERIQLYSHFEDVIEVQP